MINFITLPLITLFLLTLQAIFAGSEIALLSCDKSKIRSKADSGSSAAKLVMKSINRIEEYVSTSLVGENLCIVINTVIVSIDAGTEETYKIVRRGGHWKQLNKNLDMLGKLRANNEISELRLDNCIQTRNYKEMPLMVELGLKVNADTVYFSKLIDWNNFWDGGDEYIGNNKFQDHNITSTNHPEHKQFLDVINQPIMGHKIVDLGNISSYRV